MTSSKRDNCSSAKVLSVSSDCAKWVIAPSSRNDFSRQSFQQRQRLVPAHAVAAHAGVDFDVDGNAFARGGGDAGQLADRVRVR